MTSMIVLSRSDTFESSPVAIFDGFSRLIAWVENQEHVWGEPAIWNGVNHQVRLAGSKYHWLEVPYYETEKEL